MDSAAYLTPKSATAAASFCLTLAWTTGSWLRGMLLRVLASD
jgi:hypothetical protein